MKFNLSDCIIKETQQYRDIIPKGNIKEFIRLLKKMNFGRRNFRIINEIDKLAGKELI